MIFFLLLPVVTEPNLSPLTKCSKTNAPTLVMVKKMGLYERPDQASGAASAQKNANAPVGFREAFFIF